MQHLISTLQELGYNVQLQTDAYVYATYNAGQEADVTDLEFLFADNDNTVSLFWGIFVGLVPWCEQTNIGSRQLQQGF